MSGLAARACAALRTVEISTDKSHRQYSLGCVSKLHISMVTTHGVKFNVIGWKITGALAEKGPAWFNDRVTSSAADFVARTSSWLTTIWLRDFPAYDNVGSTSFGLRRVWLRDCPAYDDLARRFGSEISRLTKFGSGFLAQKSAGSEIVLVHTICRDDSFPPGDSSSSTHHRNCCVIVTIRFPLLPKFVYGFYGNDHHRYLRSLYWAIVRLTT